MCCAEIRWCWRLDVANQHDTIAPWSDESWALEPRGQFGQFVHFWNLWTPLPKAEPKEGDEVSPMFSEFSWCAVSVALSAAVNLIFFWKCDEAVVVCAWRVSYEVRSSFACFRRDLHGVSCSGVEFLLVVLVLSSVAQDISFATLADQTRLAERQHTRIRDTASKIEKG